MRRSALPSVRAAAGLAIGYSLMSARSCRQRKREAPPKRSLSSFRRTSCASSTCDDDERSCGRPWRPLRGRSCGRAWCSCAAFSAGSATARALAARGLLASGRLLAATRALLAAAGALAAGALPARAGRGARRRGAASPSASRSADLLDAFLFLRGLDQGSDERFALLVLWPITPEWVTLHTTLLVGDFLYDLAGLRVVSFAGDVSLGHKPHESTVFLDHRQSTNLVLCHQAQRFVEVLLGIDRHEVR